MKDWINISRRNEGLEGSNISKRTERLDKLIFLKEFMDLINISRRTKRLDKLTFLNELMDSINIFRRII